MAYLIIGGIILVAIIVIIILSIMQTNKVKKEGIEADAFVSRIDVEESTDSDGMTSTTGKYFVRYTGQDGKQIEARLANPRKGLVMGDRIKVKYLPEKPKYAVMVDEK